MSSAQTTLLAHEIHDEWMLKEDAAKLLGTNPRSVERLCRRGKVERKYLPKQPNERQARVVYSRRDLEAVMNGTAGEAYSNKYEAIDPVSKQPTTSTALARVSEVHHDGRGALALAQVDALGVLAAHLAKLSATYAPAHPPKAWLTFEEAAEYSGLPPGQLRHLLQMETVYAFGRGPKTWRVQRASLDAYGQAAHQ